AGAGEGGERRGIAAEAHEAAAASEERLCGDARGAAGPSAVEQRAGEIDAAARRRRARDEPTRRLRLQRRVGSVAVHTDVVPRSAPRWDRCKRTAAGPLPAEQQGLQVLALRMSERARMIGR